MVNPDLTSDSIGRLGVHAVGAIVSSLGWFFREQPVSDFGVDAHVEAPNASGQPSGRLLALQIKSGKRWFREENPEGVVYRGNLRHLAYWKQHSLPVILVLYDPATRNCLWQVIEPEKIEPTAKGWKIVVPFAQTVDKPGIETWSRLCNTHHHSITLRVTEFVDLKSSFLKFAGHFCNVNLLKVGKRYRPELYVQRQSDTFIWEWLMDRDTFNAKCLVLVERAGSGKTNLICNITQRLLAEEHPCVLLLGSDPLTNRLSLIVEVLRALGLESGSGDQATTAIYALDEATGGRPLCILLDAINETRDVELMQNALAELCAWLQPLPVRILISCRDIYWHFLKGDWVDIVKSDIRSLDLYKYDLESWPEVRERYLSAFKISGVLSGDAEEKCRHPLLFRFFCEAYEGEDVSEVTQIRLKPLFERYLQKKVQRVALQDQSLFRAEENITMILQAIAGEMLSTREMSVPESRIPSLTSDAQHLRRDSIYIRLLDEDIIIEEIPDQESTNLTRRVRFVYEAFLEFMLAREMSARWRGQTNDEIVEDLVKLLEPGATLRNTLGALSFLGELFIERNLSLWRILAERGARWQSLVLASLRECAPENLDRLQQEAFPALINASNLDTRVAAVNLLRSPDARRILDPDNQFLFARFQSDKRREVRRDALVILREVWNELKPRQRLRVAEAVLDPSREIRNYATNILPLLKPGERKRFFMVLDNALRSPSGKTRSYAALAMYLPIWEEGRAPLISSLQDPNPWVRRASLIRLQAFPSQADIPALLPLLLDPEPKVRSLAAILCGRWQYREFVEPLLERIKVEENGTVLSRLVEAVISLGSVNSRNVVPFLKSMLSNKNYWVRAHAGKGLFDKLGAKSFDFLVQSFIEEQPLGGWFKQWPQLSSIGGPAGVLQLCDLTFVNEDFSQDTGAFLAGLFAPRAMIAHEVLREALREWFVKGLPRLPPHLAEHYLIGFRSSRWKSIRSAEMRQTLSDLLLYGPDLLRPHAVYLLAACDFLDEPELEVVFEHSDIKLRQQLALGLGGDIRDLKKDFYFSELELSQNEYIYNESLRFVDDELPF
jgi:HEAT repeat protein